MEEPNDFLSLIRIAPDPRIEGMESYPLGEILLVALVGTLCRMEAWDEIASFAEEQQEWLRRFLAFENGIASAKTFGRRSGRLTIRPFRRPSRLGSLTGAGAASGSGR